MRALVLCLLLAPALIAAQEQERVFFYPKPLSRPAYKPPMKPVTRLLDLKAKHKGKVRWREPIIDDGNEVGHADPS